MSGTSMDGLDIAFCSLIKKDKWEFKIIKAETVEYSIEWLNKLKTIHSKSGAELIELHNAYGKELGLRVNRFIEKNKIQADFIASHGHTIYHQPGKEFTFQLGAGSAIAATTGITTISDFRTLDVNLGGQGAPLVPIGDKLLFSMYDYCLNLGGFANISYDNQSKRIAFDICPVNIILNRLAAELNEKFDNKGKLASSGLVCNALLDELNKLDFYKTTGPKSLGIEWLEKNFIPILAQYEIPVNDKLRTITEHIAAQLNEAIPGLDKKILITGGGAYNDFLIDRFKAYSKNKIIIPDADVINFKEALVFAFLGVLRLRNEINCLSSVTGASRDSCSGCIYIGGV